MCDHTGKKRLLKSLHALLKIDPVNLFVQILNFKKGCSILSYFSVFNAKKVKSSFNFGPIRLLCLER